MTSKTRGDAPALSAFGIVMAEGDFQEMLATDQSADALFRELWELGYELEETMLGEWSPQEQRDHALLVARSAMYWLFQSKPCTQWKNGSCVLVQQEDGRVEPMLIRGDGEAGGEMVDGEPVSIPAYAKAKAQALTVLAAIRPTPAHALLIFGWTNEGRLHMRYQPLDMRAIAASRASLDAEHTTSP